MGIKIGSTLSNYKVLISQFVKWNQTGKISDKRENKRENGACDITVKGTQNINIGKMLIYITVIGFNSITLRVKKYIYYIFNNVNNKKLIFMRLINL